MEIEGVFNRIIYNLDNELFSKLDSNLQEITALLNSNNKLLFLNDEQTLFFKLRLKLIRNNKFDFLNQLLRLIEQNSNKYNTVESIDLVVALRINYYWHVGKVDLSISTWETHKSNFTNVDFKNLAELFLAFVYNTTCNYKQSLEILNRLAFKSRLIDEILQLTPELTILSWKIWAYNELDIFLPENELDFNLIRNCNDARSKNLVLLAISIYYLERNKFEKAEFYLSHSTLSKDKNYAIWNNRIKSALSIIDFHNNKLKSSLGHLYDCYIDISYHFGPLGWKLRVAKALALNNFNLFAICLFQDILTQTRIKNETSYMVKSGINLFELKYLNLEELAILKKVSIIKNHLYLLRKISSLEKNIIYSKNKSFNHYSNGLKTKWDTNGFIKLSQVLPLAFMQRLIELYNYCLEHRTKLKVDNCPALEYFSNPDELIGDTKEIKFLKQSLGLILIQILGVKTVANNTSVKIFHKLSGAANTEPHQDSAYIKNENDNLKINVWLSLDERCSINSGCLYYDKGSHKKGLLKHYKSKKDNSGKTLYTSIRKQHVENVETRLGDIILHNSLVVHGSNKNSSKFDRKAMVMSLYYTKK